MKNQYRRRGGYCLKRRLGQFADLRGRVGLGKNEGVVFEGGLIPQCTLPLHTKELVYIELFAHLIEKHIIYIRNILKKHTKKFLKFDVKVFLVLWFTSYFFKIIYYGLCLINNINHWPFTKLSLLLQRGNIFQCYFAM